MFINIDVFGTIRSRTELHLYNAETLKAQTKLEYFAIDKNNQQLLIKPTTNAYEAQYQERYALWTGPYAINKNIKATDGLMVDFSDIEPYAHSTQGSLKSESLHQAQSNEAQSNEANFATPATSEAEPRIAPQRPSDEIIRKRQGQ